MPLQDPEGATRYSLPSNSAMTLAASALAPVRSPALYPGCPQQVCGGGTQTSAPPASSSRTAARPIDGRIRSTRQVTNRPTRIESFRLVRMRQRQSAQAHQTLRKNPEQQQREPVHGQQQPGVATRLEGLLVDRIVEVHQLDDAQIIECADKRGHHGDHREPDEPDVDRGPDYR